MKTEFERIQRITAKDMRHKTIFHLLASAGEELGEVSRELKIEEEVFGNGHKVSDEGSKLESVDLMIVALALYFARGGTIDDLPQYINRKLDKWESCQNT